MSKINRNFDLGSGIGRAQWWKAIIVFSLLNMSVIMIGLKLQPNSTLSSYLKPSVPASLSPSAMTPARPIPDEATVIATTDTSFIDNAPIPDEPSGLKENHIDLTTGRGDTLGNLLNEAGVNGREAYDAIKALSTLFAPRQLKLGQKLRLTLSQQDGQPTELQKLILKSGFGEEVHVSKMSDGRYQAEQIELAIEARPVLKEGTIEDSLYLSGERIDVPAPILIQLIQIYSYSVDFQREIRQGDGFRVLYEEKRAEDGEIDLGNIRFAELILRGEAMPLFRYTPSDDGNTDYFSPDGKSTRRLLMKTPIDGARLSSGFGKRKHPVLGYVKSHRGVDFAAPTGTPIYAAGNGVVERASRYGSYGNYVRIRHNGTYKTAYAHLSKYGRGIKAGTRVKQGQIIGYVGATGRVTGAHLHYEILMNEAQVNPQSLKLPTGRSLTGPLLAAFLEVKQDIEQETGLKFANVSSNSSPLTGAN